MRATENFFKKLGKIFVGKLKITLKDNNSASLSRGFLIADESNDDHEISSSVRLIAFDCATSFQIFLLLK